MNFFKSNFLQIAVISVAVFLFFRIFLTPKSTILENSGGKILDRKGQEFFAPATSLEARTLKKDIDFNDAEVQAPQEISEIVLYTNNGDYTFASRGAVLTGVEFKHHKSAAGEPLHTIFTAGKTDDYRGGAFLVAFDQGTPLNYQVEEQQQNVNGASFIKFKAKTDAAVIYKTFTVNDSDYKVVCNLEIMPKAKGIALRPRMVFDTPTLLGLKDDRAQGLVSTEDSKSLLKVDEGKLDLAAWKYAEMIGSQNRYFLNVYLAQSQDQENSVQRAFFKKLTADNLQAYLELPEITDNFSTTLSFYIGPKTVGDLKAVDQRLTGVLDFGWFDWVCELFIRVLEAIHKLVGNYGIAIIGLALLIRFLFAPLSFFARKKFNKISNFERTHAAELAAIDRQFKDDWVKRSAEKDAFYKRHGQSQAAKMFNLIPLVLELPLVIASYKIFGNYLAFYNAPLALWITDLSLRDPLFVLPVLFGAAGLLREAAFRDYAKASQPFSFSTLLMPALLVVIFSNFSSGLVLYMLCNSLFISLEALFYDLLLARRIG